MLDALIAVARAAAELMFVFRGRSVGVVLAIVGFFLALFASVVYTQYGGIGTVVVLVIFALVVVSTVVVARRSVNRRIREGMATSRSEGLPRTDSASGEHRG